MKKFGIFGRGGEEETFNFLEVSRFLFCYAFPMKTCISLRGSALTFYFEGGGGIENIWTIIRGGAMKQLKCGVLATKKDWNPENSLTLFHIFCSGYPRIQFAAPYMANIG